MSHTHYEFGSILKFVENVWQLGSLGTTDARAKSIIDSFDFASRRAPSNSHSVEVLARLSSNGSRRRTCPSTPSKGRVTIYRFAKGCSGSSSPVSHSAYSASAWNRLSCAGGTPPRRRGGATTASGVPSVLRGTSSGTRTTSSTSSSSFKRIAASIISSRRFRAPTVPRSVAWRRSDARASSASTCRCKTVHNFHREVRFRHDLPRRVCSITISVRWTVSALEGGSKTARRPAGRHQGLPIRRSDRRSNRTGRWRSSTCSAINMFQTQGSGSFTAHQDLDRRRDVHRPGQRHKSIVDFPTHSRGVAMRRRERGRRSCSGPGRSSKIEYDKGPFPCSKIFPTMAQTLRDAARSARCEIVCLGSTTRRR